MVFKPDQGTLNIDIITYNNSDLAMIGPLVDFCYRLLINTVEFASELNVTIVWFRTILLIMLKRDGRK